MHSEYERELRYGDPKLADLKPRALRLHEWLGFGLLWLGCVALGCFGGLGIIIGWDLVTDESQQWYLTWPVLICGLASLLCAVLLWTKLSECRRRVLNARAKRDFEDAAKNVHANIAEHLEMELSDDMPRLDSYLRLAREHICVGHPDKAKRVLDRALQDYAAAAELHLLLGKASALQGDISAAATAWNRCRELSRTDREIAALENAELHMSVTLRRHYSP